MANTYRKFAEQTSESSHLAETIQPRQFIPYSELDPFQMFVSVKSIGLSHSIIDSDWLTTHLHGLVIVCIAVDHRKRLNESGVVQTSHIIH